MEAPTVGKQLRIFRESRQMKQQEFCEYTGIKQQTVSGIETGRSEPSTAMLQLLFQKFPDLNPDWLLLGTGPMLRDGKVLTPVVAEPNQPGPAPDAPSLSAESNSDPYFHRYHALLDMVKTGFFGSPEQLLTKGKKSKASAEAADLYATVDAIAAEHSARLAGLPQLYPFRPTPVVRPMTVGFGRQTA